MVWRGRQECPDLDLDFHVSSDLKAEGKSPPSALFDPVPQKETRGHPHQLPLNSCRQWAALSWDSGVARQSSDRAPGGRMSQRPLANIGALNGHRFRSRLWKGWDGSHLFHSPIYVTSGGHRLSFSSLCGPLSSTPHPSLLPRDWMISFLPWLLLSRLSKDQQ